jgi:hypothetical protein
LSEAKLLDVTSSFMGSSIQEFAPIQSLTTIGTFFWVPNPSSATPPLVEKWLRNDGIFFVGTKNETAPSRAPSFSVVSVYLSHIQGTLADYVVRTNTVGGIVPDVLNSCNSGDTIAIPYTANYLFFNESSKSSGTSVSAPSNSGVNRVEISGLIVPGIFVAIMWQMLAG